MLGDAGPICLSIWVAQGTLCLWFWSNREAERCIACMWNSQKLVEWFPFSFLYPPKIWLKGCFLLAILVSLKTTQKTEKRLGLLEDHPEKNKQNRDLVSFKTPPQKKRKARRIPTKRTPAGQVRARKPRLAARLEGDSSRGLSSRQGRRKRAAGWASP